MKKLVKIDNYEIEMSANGDTPRAYRREYGSDLFKSLMEIEKTMDTSVLENLAYLMAKNCNSEIGTIDEWLSQFSPMGIVKAGEDIISVWNDNLVTTSEPVKK